MFEIKNEMKDRELDIKRSNMGWLIEEKRSLQATVASLGQEVEELSIKNEEFLQELKQKDFYSEYS